MNNKKILIIQTAFLGDVILTLPLVQVLRKHFPDSRIDFICIPQTEGLLKNNPYINEVIVYDKKAPHNKKTFSLIKNLRNKKYDLVISPHRSFRTSLISFFSNASKTISFDKSSFSFLYTDKTKYIQSLHEIQRNLSLLGLLGIKENKIIPPELFPGDDEVDEINSFFSENNININDKIISIAPGSVWFTKRFSEEKFVKLCDELNETECKIILTGGKDDSAICRYIIENSVNDKITDASGKFSILESAEIIKRSLLLITNDSAPLHIANSFGTDVIAIFGATIPAFGFYPYGKNDYVFQTEGLNCRPCSIHGGHSCPIKTFICMKNIEEKNIAERIKTILSQKTV